MPAKPNLLLCFDAFGTLFTPKRPIAQQYGEVARSLGLGPFSDDQVAKSFKEAFKDEAKRHPNFGKDNGMNAEKWWTNIIHNTFRPLTGSAQDPPQELAPALLHRFGSSEGYDLRLGALELLRELRSNQPQAFERVAVGVITNSDDRVPKVLSSLGLKVSPLTLSHDEALPVDDEDFDVEFTIMSYDVGVEKPKRRIFEAAEQLLMRLPVARLTERDAWEKMYVGDEYDKDVVGATGAGWHSILLSERPPADLLQLDGRERGALLQSLQSKQTKATCSGFDALAIALGLR